MKEMQYEGMTAMRADARSRAHCNRQAISPVSSTRIGPRLSGLRYAVAWWSKEINSIRRVATEGVALTSVLSDAFAFHSRRRVFRRLGAEK
jgi:hypothetical protein